MNIGWHCNEHTFVNFIKGQVSGVFVIPKKPATCSWPHPFLNSFHTGQANAAGVDPWCWLDTVYLTGETNSSLAIYNIQIKS